MSMNNRSISVIGLDGLGKQYLNKMINSGEIPYLKHAVTKADVNVNIHCFPPSTPSSWPSLMSGVNIGKHGIYDFFKYVKGKIRLFSALDLGHPRIHEMIAMQKHQVLMINPVPSYPIIPVSNTMHVISLTFFTPKPAAYPDFLNKYVEKYKQYKYKTLEEFFEYYINDLDYRLNILEELTRKFDYRLIWVNFEIPDRILHLVSEQKKQYDVLDKVVLEYERIIFRKLNSVIKLLGSKTDNIAIVSDHGFSYYDKSIAVNTILYKHGFVKISEKGLASKEEEELSKVLPRKSKPQTLISANNPLVRLARTPIIKSIARTLIRIYAKLFKREIRIKFPEVDHDGSKAFLFSEHSSAVMVNKRLYNGSPSDIAGTIKKYKGIKYVWLKDEIFSGPYLDDLPDIYIYPDYDNGCWIVNSKIYDKIYGERPRLQHHPLGVFIMKDLDGYKLLNRTINNTAVAPIIMGWMSFPLSSWIDDKDLIEKVFGENIKYTDKYIKLWNLNKRIFVAKLMKK